LIAIAHNVCRQRFRQTSRRPSEVSFEDDIADTVADEAAGLSLEGLTTEFTTESLRALDDVDAEVLTKAYGRYVTGEWTVIIVGDASLYAEGVRALGRGEVVVLPA